MFLHLQVKEVASGHHNGIIPRTWGNRIKNMSEISTEDPLRTRKICRYRKFRPVIQHHKAKIQASQERGQLTGHVAAAEQIYRAGPYQALRKPWFPFRLKQNLVCRLLPQGRKPYLRRLFLQKREVSRLCRGQPGDQPAVSTGPEASQCGVRRCQRSRSTAWEILHRQRHVSAADHSNALQPLRP